MLKALEISLMTGRPYSSFLTRKRKVRNFNIIKTGLAIERKELYTIINSRTDEMMEQGLLAEAEYLYQYRNLNALNTVGYKELFDYLEGKTGLEKAVEMIKRNTRRYAKRQMTWLARDQDITWFDPSDLPKIIAHIKKLTGHSRTHEKYD